MVIKCGDCIEVMKELDECSIDAVVSDPPYGLAFMNKDWDSFKPRAFQEFSFQWGEQALRVLKPGGWCLAFSGTRTYHRMVCGLEDAGFKIKDSMCWMYGSGFPKSLDISKAIDKHFGVEREIIRIGNAGLGKGKPAHEGGFKSDYFITAPYTNEAKQWNGWGTSLKPAFEPIVVAQKPIEGTYAANVLKWGVGGLNIDASRIQYGQESDSRVGTDAQWGGKRDASKHTVSLPAVEGMQMYKNNGRFPANVLLTHHPDCKVIGTKEVGNGKVKHNSEIVRKGLGNHGAIFRTENSGFDVNKCQGPASYGVEEVPAYECHPDCPLKLLDDQSGETVSKWSNIKSNKNITSIFGMGTDIEGIKQRTNKFIGDKGSASRFFYSGKAQKNERNAGLDGVVKGQGIKNFMTGTKWIIDERHKEGGYEIKESIPDMNNIATLKPINLMRYLVRLVCPKGGTVLDPFAGSGTTGIACVIEGMKHVLIEKRERFAKTIIPLRLKYWKDPRNWELLNDHNALEPLKKLKRTRLGQRTMEGWLA